MRKKQPTPLDAMLDDEEADPMRDKAEKRFEELQGERKKSSREDASAVLVKRVMEGPEREQRKKKKKKKKETRSWGAKAKVHTPALRVTAMMMRSLISGVRARMEISWDDNRS